MNPRSRRDFIKKIKSSLHARYASLFPNPAEVRLLEVCGGITLTIGKIKRHGRPMTIIFSEGRLLKSEQFQRIALDNKAILYMNDINQVIAIQGNDYERNIVKYQELEDSLLERGMRVRYIPQRWLESNPMRALESIQQFIYN